MLEIIVVKYNLPEYESETIEQVMKVAQAPYHLTVVDNYQRDENLSTVWNRAIKNSTAEYICLLNNDTVVSEGWDIKLLEVLKRTDVVMRDDDAFLTRSPRMLDRAPYYNFDKFKSVHEFLADEGLKHSIGIVSGEIKDHPEMKEYILSAKEEYELCSHSHEHKDYSKMTSKEQEEDIKKSVETIEDEFQIRVHKFYAPFNHIDTNLIETCKKLKIELDTDFINPGQALAGMKAHSINFHYWADEQIKDLKEWVKKLPKAGAVGPITNHAGNHQSGFAGAATKKLIEPCTNLSGFCLMFPKYVWKKVGGFNEKYHLYGEDSEFVARISKKFPMFTRYDAYVYHYGSKSTKVAEDRGNSIEDSRVKAVKIFRQYAQS
jgi:peptidoglycan/xylan/chitin deacetylase (PgdA/CDA1 family)